jgi:hypothetical protein
MKLTTATNVCLDGVTQGHRQIHVGDAARSWRAEEHGSGGFERFGWGPPLLDDAPPRSSAKLSSAPTRSCSAGGPTRSSRLLGCGHGSGKPRRRGGEHTAQVGGLDHAQEPAMGEYDRPVR